MDHGGSFVRALAVAYTLGDPTNRAKIRETWPDYWTKYSNPMMSAKGGGAVVERLEKDLRGVTVVRQAYAQVFGTGADEEESR